MCSPQVAVALPPITKSSSTSKLKYEYKDGEFSAANTGWPKWSRTKFCCLPVSN